MPEKELKRLNTVNRFLQLNISKEEELQQITELAARICEMPIAMISFIDAETQYIKYKTGVSATTLPVYNSICLLTIEQKNLLIINNIKNHLVYKTKLVLNDANICFYAGLPLITHDGQNIGTLCVCDYAPGKLSSIQQKMLQRLSKQVSQLLEFDASLALLKAQADHARAEEDKLRSFFESTSSCHLLLDSELRVIAYNKAMVCMLNEIYGLAIMEGMPVIYLIEPDFVNEFTANCQSALKGERLRTKSFVASPNGYIPWSLTYDPAYDTEGRITGVSYSATDITLSINHEKKLNDQDYSFRQIHHILAHGLAGPMRSLTNAMAKLPELSFPKHSRELEMLQVAFEELKEKRKLLDTKALRAAKLPAHEI